MSSNARKNRPNVPTRFRENLNLREAVDTVTRQADDTRPVALGLNEIVEDIDDLQVRADGLHEPTVQQYTTILENGGELPPVVVFDTGQEMLLAAGYHRIEAHRRAGREAIEAIIRKGDRLAAIEYAEEDNLTHGLPLTNEDKKTMLLARLRRGHEWINISNREIARRLGVSAPTIGNWIRDFESTVKNFTVERTKTVGADGKVRDTSDIGSKQQDTSQSTVQNYAVETGDREAYNRKMRDIGVEEAIDDLDNDSERRVTITQNGRTVDRAPVPTGQVRMGPDKRLMVERDDEQPVETSNANDVGIMISEVRESLQVIYQVLGKQPINALEPHLYALDEVFNDVINIQEFIRNRIDSQ